MKERKLLFSLKPGRDFFFQPYKASGPGGQNRNKRDTAIRLEHPESGVVVTACEERHQRQNKKSAVKKLTSHPKFKFWLYHKVNNTISAEKIVEEQMQEKYLKVEIKQDNKWTAVKNIVAST